MLKRCVVFLTACLCGAAACAAGTPALLARWMKTESASGTFTQRKTLADVEVTIVSRGTFRFEKDKSFEWKTLSPLESTFSATREAYTMTADGRSTTRKLSELQMSDGLCALVTGDLGALGAAFDTAETDGALRLTPKDRNVRAILRRLTLAGDDFPRRVTLDYTNGDKLDIELAR